MSAFEGPFEGLSEALTYDDVLLVPQYSDIQSRKEVDISADLFPHRNRKSPTPIIASPMDTVCGPKMVFTIGRLGGVGILHRYNSIEDQVKMSEEVRRLAFDAGLTVPVYGAAIPAGADYMERTEALVKSGVHFVCIDVAHGYHAMVKIALKNLKERYPYLPIMAGNVATAEAFSALEDWGADAIRVGIGGGSICSTRIQTGHGVPSITSIANCAAVAHSAILIADGGIRNSGDIVKALAAGADMVMVGSLLSGTDETPGDVVDGKKLYRGMASRSAQQDWRGISSAPEGVTTYVKHKGSLKPVFDDLVGGIKSGLSYTGARTIKEFQQKAKMILQSSAGQRESSPHILG